jgi:hypothetical protein
VEAQLNLHEGKQVHDINEWETYSATLAWPTIQFLQTQSLIMGWHTSQINFTLVCSQADAECQLLIGISKGFIVSGGNSNHCLEILETIFGQRQAGQIWSLHFKKGPQAYGFMQSQVDECMLYKDTVICMVYVKNTILLSPLSKSIIVSLQALWTRFNLTEERDTADYLRLQVTRLSTSTLSQTQPNSISSSSVTSTSQRTLNQRIHQQYPHTCFNAILMASISASTGITYPLLIN